MPAINTATLRISYREDGSSCGLPIILLHGFPYDTHVYDEVIPPLAAKGYRVITPYLRGFGDTAFLSPETPRSGQQGALAQDLLELMDALDIERALLAGYDWGGRAACVVAALWPQRVLGLVTGCGYNIHDIANAINPEPPQNEYNYWYQYYLHSERGRRALEQGRADFCRFLWKLWSPNWVFDERTFEQTASSFDNSDFVEVAIHSYRHRFGLAAGAPAYTDIEAQLARQPKIVVPAIALHGEDDGIFAPDFSAHHDCFFGDHYQRKVLPRVGHNLPQEAPGVFAEAIVSLID